MDNKLTDQLHINEWGSVRIETKDNRIVLHFSSGRTRFSSFLNNSFYISLPNNELLDSNSILQVEQTVLYLIEIYSTNSISGSEVMHTIRDTLREQHYEVDCPDFQEYFKWGEIDMFYTESTQTLSLLNHTHRTSYSPVTREQANSLQELAKENSNLEVLDWNLRLLKNNDKLPILPNEG